MGNHPNRNKRALAAEHRRIFLSAYGGKRVRVRETGAVGTIVDLEPSPTGFGAAKLVIDFGRNITRTLAARDVELEQD